MQLNNKSKKLDVRQFRQALRILEREISLRLALEQSCCGVTLAQCHVLLELEMNNGSQLNELSARTGLDKSTLSRTVDSLVQAGFVDRTIPEHNRRSVQLTLTEKGRLETDSINAECDTYYGRVLESVPLGERSGIIESVMNVGRAFEKVRLTQQKCCRIFSGKKEK